MDVRFPLTCLAAALVLGQAGRADATERLRNGIRDKLAVKIQKLLQQEEQQAVAVGDFSGPPQLGANPGPGLRQLLADELKALNVRVDNKKANLTVSGRFVKLENPDRKGLILVRITAQVHDRNDQLKGTFPVEIEDSADIAQLLGVTVSLPPETEGGKARHQELDQNIEHPGIHIRASKVSAKAGSPFSVEVLVKPSVNAKAVERTARLEDGRAFVDVRRKELYEIRVHNQSAHEVGVAITIDGLDVFAFSEVRNPKTNRPRYTHYIVAPKKQATIVGWHLRDKQPNNYSSFLVTEYGKGASARVVDRASGEQGVITVAFFPSYQGAKPRTSNDETGFGPPVSVKVQPVQRFFGAMLEAVSIRYTR
jgi:hypothetical protein